jgi:hypothetical protein
MRGNARAPGRARVLLLLFARIVTGKVGMRYRSICLPLMGVVSLALLATSPAAAQVPAGKAVAVRRPRAFDLSAAAAGLQGVRLDANRVECNGITANGRHCTDLSESGTVEGGYWPLGTGDNYVFNGGLQVVGLIPADAGFGWAGDTVGVFFMDPRGDQRQGSAVSGIYDSRNASQLAGWPEAAYVTDTSLYAPTLIGRAAISDQDTWARYWDGNPALARGRGHMMGVVVDQRTLSWNRPDDDRDIVYFIFRLINATSSVPASYDDLAAFGYSAADRQALADLGARFQAAAESLDVTLHVPDSGYSFHHLYVGYYQDPDVGNASFNYSTAVLPFSLIAAMKSNYAEPLWQYPVDVFHTPFALAPGYEAIQFLRGAADSADPGARVALWSNTCGGCGLLRDPIGVQQLYRYLSGGTSPALGDGQCNSDPVAQHACTVLQAYADTRFFESTGPAELAPGHSLLVAVAMLYAAPLAAWPATTNGIYAMPAGQLQPYVNAGTQETFFPGWPATADTLALVGTAGGTRVCTSNCDQTATIREPVERAMGWGQFSDANADGRIEMDEVQTAPRSLLRKAQVAQAVFDRKFLLAAPPAGPRFYLIPGDGQVTVVWEPSASEQTGDPYVAAASDPTSPLYDPDYRGHDVEGYRIWRGTSASDLKVIAQYDYAGTWFTDYTGQVFDPSYPRCAPELGIDSTCRVIFGYPYGGAGPGESYPLAGPVIQILPGGRILTADGSVLVLKADTAVTGGGTGYPPLTDNGVPFSYVDSAVTNSFPYVYAVTAFDVNSVVSGPSSQQSALALQSVTPRVPALNAHDAAIVTGIYGDDDVALDTATAGVTIDSATGAFRGPVPPANGASVAVLHWVSELMGPGDITAHIDSLTPGTVGGFGGPYAKMYVTLSSATDTTHVVVGFDDGMGYYQVNIVDLFSWWPFQASSPLVRYDSARGAALGIGAQLSADARAPVQFSGVVAPSGAVSDGNYTMNARRYPWGGFGAADDHSAYLNHPVWYDEGSAEPPQPTVSPFASPDHSNGKLTGVSMIYEPIAYRQPVTGVPPGINVNYRYVQYGTSLGHPGDFVVTWNADSSISVRDSTHHVPLRFRPDMGVSWGFVNARAFTAAGVTAADIADGTGSPTIGVVGSHHAYAIHPVCDDVWGGQCAPLERTAEYEPVDYTNDGAANGSGIMLYIDGSFYVMAMSALPAAGTKWHLKVVHGIVNATCSTYNPATPADVPAACSNYTYRPWPYRQAYVPGLRYRIRVTQAAGVSAGAGDLRAIHTVPDPYYNHSAYEVLGGPRELRFVNLPAQCIIRIYSASGILVRLLTHNDATGGGEEPWNLLNRGGREVASGVYFYHVQAADARTRVGRLTIVNMTN